MILMMMMMMIMAMVGHSGGDSTDDHETGDDESRALLTDINRCKYILTGNPSLYNDEHLTSQCLDSSLW